jgi:hypothetical protein
VDERIALVAPRSSLRAGVVGEQNWAKRTWTILSVG